MKIILSIIIGFLAGRLLMLIGPFYTFVFIMLLLTGYAFLFHFRKMFVFFIIARPIFDIFGKYGLNVGYSNINMAAIISAFFCIGGIFYILANKKQILYSKEIITFIVFLIFAFISTVFNVGIVGLEGVISWLRLLVVLVVMLIIASDYNETKSLVRLMKYILYSACIPVIYAVIQIFTRINMSSGQGFDRINGGFSHGNIFATYLSMFIIMILCMLVFNNTIVTKKGRLYLFLFVISLVVCFFLTYARGAWIGLIVSMFIIGALFLRKKMLIGIAFIIFLLSIGYLLSGKVMLADEVMRRFADLHPMAQVEVIDPGQNSLSWRIVYWKDLLYKLKDSPIIGFGFGSVPILGSAHMDAHNNYIQVLFETGIVGISYFIMIFMFFWQACKNTHHHNLNIRAYSAGVLGVIIAYLINSISGHLIRNAVYQVYFLSFLMIMPSLAKTSAEDFLKSRKIHKIQ